MLFNIFHDALEHVFRGVFSGRVILFIRNAADRKQKIPDTETDKHIASEAVGAVFFHKPQDLCLDHGVLIFAEMMNELLVFLCRFRNIPAVRRFRTQPVQIRRRDPENIPAVGALTACDCPVDGVRRHRNHIPVAERRLFIVDFHCDFPGYRKIEFIIIMHVRIYVLKVRITVIEDFIILVFPHLLPAVELRSQTCFHIFIVSQLLQCIYQSAQCLRGWFLLKLKL